MLFQLQRYNNLNKQKNFCSFFEIFFVSDKKCIPLYRIMLELKDATLTVEGRKVFARLSMIAQDGQMTCITGPEGSGKTLLLRVFMGFVPLDEGYVSVDGELVTSLSAPSFRKKMAYLPSPLNHQPSALNPQPSALNTLETLWSTEPLGGWEIKPVEMPVVTIQEKQIILADEPQANMLSQLRTMANDGRTVVVTTRDETFMNMSDKTIRLQNDEHIIY